MKPFFKIRAGALQFVVFIGVVIAILIATFVTLVYVNTKFSIQTNLLVKTIENASKGIEMSLIKDYPFRDTINISPQNSEYETLKLYKSFWGIYETATTIATIKKNKVVNHAFIGNYSKQFERTGLYLAEDNQPLVVVGNTFINGKNYLPKQGIKPGNISGTSYNGNLLIYGSTTTSSESLPKLNPNSISEITRLQNILNVSSEPSLIQFDEISSIKNSFKDDVKLVYASEAIYLSNVEMIGHVILYSEKKITVSAASVLKDIILIAPKIEILNSFKGNFQAIASEEIIVKENVTLNYPSALILYNTKANTSSQNLRTLELSKNSIINGQIIVDIPSNDASRFEPQLKINNTVTIVGEVHCNQNVEHLGTVKGSFYARRFIAKQSGSVYMNHIYNGRIDASQLPEDYVGLLFENPSIKKVMKWGY